LVVPLTMENSSWELSGYPVMALRSGANVPEKQGPRIRSVQLLDSLQRRLELNRIEAVGRAFTHQENSQVGGGSRKD
jgi:hypothetical protein